MKSFLVLLLITLFIGEDNQAQNISKIEPPDFSESFLEIREILNDPDIPFKDKLQSLEHHDPDISNPFERYLVSFWYYPNLYQELGMEDRILPVLQSGQQEGLFYPLLYAERKWPPYVKKIEGQEGFDEFLAQNEQMRKEASENPGSEYFVVLPKNYDESRNYPLMVVLHGGTGSHYQAYLSWQSPELEKDFIIVFLQGAVYRGSYGRRYDPESFENTLAMYRQVLDEYPVDTSMVFIGGPSAGGYRSIMLGLRQIIPASGLLLMFPVIPPDLDNTYFKESSERKLRVVLITGEHDFSIREQKELAFRLDTAGIANRFIIFSGKGHEYPDELEDQIDLSLEFLRMKPERDEERLVR